MTDGVEPSRALVATAALTPDLVDLSTLPPFDVCGEAVRARSVEGDRITLAIVELAPGAVVGTTTT